MERVEKACPDTTVSRRDRPDGARDAALLAAVADVARDKVGEWFPDLDGAPLRVELLQTRRRPRCALYCVALSDGRRRRDVVIKVRRHDAPERRIDRYEGVRPILTPERVLPAGETGYREYEGLRLIESLFGDADPARHGVLRALAWLPEHDAVVMDRIPDPTLRAVLGRQSRLRIRPVAGRPDPRAWHNAGRWLRTYHCARVPGLDQRLADRAATVALPGEYVGFLGETGHDSPLLRSLAEATADRLAADLPQRLPLVVGHGDYVSQNVFADRTGRVTGFDPMPLWRVPPYEDIARFTVGVRLLPEQNLSQGLAFDRALLDTYERAFLEGYFGTDLFPYGAVHAFQALLLLDRWGAMVSKQRRGSRSTRRAANHLRIQAASRSYRREAVRLATLLRHPA